MFRVCRKNLFAIAPPAPQGLLSSIRHLSANPRILPPSSSPVDASSRHLEIALQPIHVNVRSHLFFGSFAVIIDHSRISSEETFQDVAETEIESNWDQIVDK